VRLIEHRARELDDWQVSIIELMRRISELFRSSAKWWWCLYPARI
jgi:spore cortex formation protein SpoVR/YcgB (stage V sporulation)